MRYAFPIRALKAAALISTREQTRNYLAGVNIEPCGRHALFVATNGHQLASILVADDIADLPQQVMIPNEVIDRIKIPAATNKPRELSKAFLCFEDGKFSIEFAGISYGFEPIDGSFPAWRRVVPKTVSGEAGFFNAGLIRDFDKVAETLSGKRGERAELQQNGPGEPALISYDMPDNPEGIIAFCGVVMPYRGKPARKAPEWIFADAAPAMMAAE